MATIQDFYSELNKTEVRYVHFKSNTDIDVSFDGKGDFDVLVSDDDYERFESILTQFGARKFETIKEKRYPYVCSWLIYDEVSGNLFHIMQQQQDMMIIYIMHMNLTSVESILLRILIILQSMLRIILFHGIIF